MGTEIAGILIGAAADVAAPESQARARRDAARRVRNRFLHKNPETEQIDSSVPFPQPSATLCYFLIQPLAPRKLTTSHAPSSFRIGRIVPLSSSATLGAPVLSQA